MNTNKNVIKLVYTALLTALAIIIPLYFGFLKIMIPPFTATIASHVPMFLSMLLGPWSAIMVGIGSAFGFLMTTSPVIAARALMHVFVGLAGALLIRRGMSMNKVIAVTAPLHGILEAFVVVPFGLTLYSALVVVGVGTVLHHAADGIISAVLVKSLSKAFNRDFVKTASAK